MNIVNRKLLTLVGWGALALGGCATTPGELDGAVVQDGESLSEDACPSGVPASIAPAADQTLKRMYNAVGVQIYVCATSATSGTPTWTLLGPQANLLKDDGELAGTHFIGPTWQGNDGSSVVGAKVAGATVDPTAVPWLLLTAKSHSTESGFFEDVTSIQRLSTVGGNAPATGCDATTLGAVVQVPYSAEYFFYKTKSKGQVSQCNGD